MIDRSPLSLEAGQPSLPESCASWADAIAALGLDEAARRTNGAFAVAMPGTDGSVECAVDRFGRETLCWSERKGSLQVFGRADAFGARDIDPQAVYDYLFFHMIPSPRTVFRGVHRLPAGHVARWDGQRMQVRPSSRLTFQPDHSRSVASFKAEFRDLLGKAVARELDGGIAACFLSGGTDSSTVAGHIKKIAGEVHTYSIGFDAAGYDEMEYARVAARHFGAVHHEYYVTPDDLVRSICKVAASYDQPFGNSSAVPAYHCALNARSDGVTRLLAGDGGDELFGGNSRYAHQKVYALWDGVPAWVRNGLVKPVLRLPGGDRVSLLRRGRNYVRDAEFGLPDRLNNYNLLLRLDPAKVLTPAFIAQVDPASVFEQQRQVWSLAAAADELDLQLAYDWRYTLAESDLPKVRGACSLAGVTVGYPLLDDALVDFSMRLPVSLKLKGRQLRWFFKEALRDLLPPEIITKTKKGFGLPFGPWFMSHAALRELASDSVRGFATRGVVRPEFTRLLLEELLPQHPGYYGEMVWILMMFEQWLRVHVPDWRLDDSAC